jgi:hypothetical protein
VTSLTPAALEVVERTTSSFPPINWLVDAMTFVHYAVPLSWAATAVCFTLAFRTMILPAVRHPSGPCLRDFLTFLLMTLTLSCACVPCSGGPDDAKQRQDARRSARYTTHTHTHTHDTHTHAV